MLFHQCRSTSFLPDRCVNNTNILHMLNLVYLDVRQDVHLVRMSLFFITVCPAGTYGIECENDCNHNYHGIQCKEMCNCLYGYTCNSVQGCIRNSTENCTEPACMSELKTNMLNDDIGTITVTSFTNRPERDSILSHVHIYLIAVSCTTLLILTALAYVRKGHSACKMNGDDHSIKEKKPGPNDIEMRRLPRAPSSGRNDMFQQRSIYQLIEV
ncbi:unnamed protein product [Mytilus edulis]|uniref:Uncharacterized protein n=1 Tax=Mytilus edulis TaxID=6550 RepID=A0A8S3UYX7_MYTED|nr:unnamed protein product [Mytilus edulis]